MVRFGGKSRYVLDRKSARGLTNQQQETSLIEQSNNFSEDVKQLATTLTNPQNIAFARQAAGLQLKNILVSNDEERKVLNEQQWFALPEEIKDHVKQSIIQTLGTESRPSSAAQCIAAIASYEIPRSQWLNIVDILKANVTAPESSESLKESSLEAIGYICQSLPRSCMEAFSNNVLTAIVFGMREDENSMEVKLAATTALLNSLEFIDVNFQNEKKRDEIMQKVFRAAQSPHPNIKVVALQCLVKIMARYYQFMENYMVQFLFPITINAMKSGIDKIVLQGIEFWSTVCKKETELDQDQLPNQVSKHYAVGAFNHLIPLLTETLTNKKSNPEDEGLTPTKAANHCITLLAQRSSGAIIEPNLPFISNKFNNFSTFNNFGRLEDVRGEDRRFSTMLFANTKINLKWMTNLSGYWAAYLLAIAFVSENETWRTKFIAISGVLGVISAISLIILYLNYWRTKSY